MHKVVVLGLDGFNPRLVERWLEDLPNLKKMQQEGIWGDIESTVPPTAPQAFTAFGITPIEMIFLMVNQSWLILKL